MNTVITFFFFFIFALHDDNQACHDVVGGYQRVSDKVCTELAAYQHVYRCKEISRGQSSGEDSSRAKLLKAGAVSEHIAAFLPVSKISKKSGEHWEHDVFDVVRSIKKLNAVECMREYLKRVMNYASYGCEMFEVTISKQYHHDQL